MVDVPVPDRLIAGAERIDTAPDRRIEFSPDHWERQLRGKGVRTTAIEALRGEAAAPGPHPTITRAELIRHASTCNLETPEGLLDAFVATMIWGGGPPRTRDRRGGDPRAPWRIATALSTTRFGEPTDLLHESRNAVREGRIADAYLVATRLHWVNGAFATKWLWLIGEVEGPCVRPLVWDSIIVGWLRQHSSSLASTGRNPTRTQRNAERYADYVTALGMWAKVLGVRGGAAQLEAHIFADQQQAG
jgi:hypothetical protein